MTEHIIKIDKDYILKFSNRAFKEIEKKTGKSLFGMLADSFAGTEEERFKKFTSFFYSVEFLTGFIWGGLLYITTPKKISYEEVEDMITPSMYKDLMPQCLNIAMIEMGFMDKTEKKNIVENPVPSPGTN